jgi:hypothetical protein
MLARRASAERRFLMNEAKKNKTQGIRHTIAQTKTKMNVSNIHRWRAGKARLTITIEHGRYNDEEADAAFLAAQVFLSIILIEKKTEGGYFMADPVVQKIENPSFRKDDDHFRVIEKIQTDEGTYRYGDSVYVVVNRCDTDEYTPGPNDLGEFECLIYPQYSKLGWRDRS